MTDPNLSPTPAVLTLASIADPASVLLVRLADPSTPACDLPFIAQAVAALKPHPFGALATPATVVLELLGDLIQKMRESEEAAQEHRALMRAEIKERAKKARDKAKRAKAKRAKAKRAKMRGTGPKAEG